MNPYFITESWVLCHLAAQRAGTQGSASSSKAYVLTSTLPRSYRIPAILTPPRIPTVSDEAGYTGLYTFIVGLISLSQGQMMAEGRLETALQRMNADTYFLSGERTENILKKMERQGYIVKVRERDGGGEESVDYIVGPRGKAEIGEKGVAGMVRRVYGKKDAEKDELEKRLVRSLGDVVLEKRPRPAVEEEEDVGPVEDNGEGTSRSNGRGSRRQSKRASGQRGRAAREAIEDEAEDDDDNEDDEDEEEQEEEEDDE